MRPTMEDLIISHYLPIKRWIYVMNEILTEEELKFIENQKEKLKILELELKKNLEMVEKYSNEVYNQKVPYMDELLEQYFGGDESVPSFQLPNVKPSWKNDGKSLESYENSHSLNQDMENLLRDEFIKGKIHREELMLKEPSEFLKIFETGMELVKPHAQRSIESVLRFSPFKSSIPIWKLQNRLSFIRTLLVFPHLNIEKYGKFSTDKAVKDFISMNKGNFYFSLFKDNENSFVRIQCHEGDKKSKSFGTIYIVKGRKKENSTEDFPCKTFTIKEGRTPAMVIVLYGNDTKLNSLEYRALIRSLAFSLHELILLNLNNFTELDTLSSNFKHVIPFLFETIATDSKMSIFDIGFNTVRVAKFFNKKFTRPLETREEFIKNILLLKLFLVHYKTEVDPVQFFNDEFVNYLKQLPNLETLEISKNVNYASLLSKKDIERPHKTFNILLSRILAGQLFEIYQLADYEGRKEIILRLLNHSPNRNGEWSIDDLLKLTKTEQIYPDYFASKRFRTSSTETNAAVIALTLKLILIYLLYLVGCRYLQQ
ncbi:predicted protein [Naegleria gruberi]|uniref:Predicted protein n=1 Tax=Naegleria gruberi TaxID=5762 RepID=D2VXM3_NAEGR|nr:uncharacterized protein NAEGRDRAFT_73801 [Naegleria gruberi]EFC38530.1 predicted protein [Naegleria gruberi]|eukprot:XP_002671274.1 predicted protein [Naegleria gruberi strain NEG-M]